MFLLFLFSFFFLHGMAFSIKVVILYFYDAESLLSSLKVFPNDISKLILYLGWKQGLCILLLCFLKIALHENSMPSKNK